MNAFVLIGKDLLSDPDIGKAPIPFVPRGQFHFGVSRQFPQAAALKQLIDDELVQMEASGRLRAIWNKATPSNPKP